MHKLLNSKLQVIYICEKYFDDVAIYTNALIHLTQIRNPSFFFISLKTDQKSINLFELHLLRAKVKKCDIILYKLTDICFIQSYK